MILCWTAFFVSVFLIHRSLCASQIAGIKRFETFEIYVDGNSLNVDCTPRVFDGQAGTPASAQDAAELAAMKNVADAALVDPIIGLSGNGAANMRWRYENTGWAVLAAVGSPYCSGEPSGGSTQPILVRRCQGCWADFGATSVRNNVMCHWIMKYKDVGNKRYRLYDAGDATDYNSAKTFCESKSSGTRIARLATVGTAAEFAAVTQLTRNSRSSWNTNAWVGAKQDSGTWFWEDGSAFHDGTSCLAGYCPTINFGGGDTRLIVGNDQTLHRRAAGNNYRPMCEFLDVVEVGSIRFMYSTVQLSLDAASSACKRTSHSGFAGHLADVYTAADEAAVKSLAGWVGTDSWLGAHDRVEAGTFTWLNLFEFSAGSVCTTNAYCDWAGSEPSSTGNRGIVASSSSGWKASVATTQRGFLCVYRPKVPNTAKSHYVYLPLASPQTRGSAQHLCRHITDGHQTGSLANIFDGATATAMQTVGNTYSHTHMWLGGSDAGTPGTWTWTGDSAVFYYGGVCLPNLFCDWDPSEPKVSAGDDYTVFKVGTATLLAEAASYTAHVMCELFGTATASMSVTPSPSHSWTLSPSDSGTLTLTPPLTPSASDSETESPTKSVSASQSVSHSVSSSRTTSYSLSASPSISSSVSMTTTLSLTATSSESASESNTTGASETFQLTSSTTQSLSVSPTLSFSPTHTITPPPTSTPSSTFTPVPTESQSLTLSKTIPPTRSPSLSISRSGTVSVSPSASSSSSWTSTPVPTSSNSLSSTRSSTRTMTKGPTEVPTGSPTYSHTTTPSRGPTGTSSQSDVLTGSPSYSRTTTFSLGPTSTYSHSMEPSRTLSFSDVATPTAPWSWTPTRSRSHSFSRTKEMCNPDGFDPLIDPLLQSTVSLNELQSRGLSGNITLTSPGDPYVSFRLFSVVHAIHPRPLELRLSLAVDVPAGERAATNGLSRHQPRFMNATFRYENVSTFPAPILLSFEIAPVPDMDIALTERATLRVNRADLVECSSTFWLPILQLVVEPPKDEVIEGTKTAEEVVTSTGMAVTLATGSSSIVDQQTIAVIGMLSCSDPYERQMFGSYRLLAPTATSESFAGVIYGNMILIGGITLVHFVALKVSYHLRGDKLPWIEACAAVRFPSLEFKLAMLVYQGTAFAAAQLLVGSHDLWENILGGIALIACVAYPVALVVYAKKRIEAQYYTYDYSESPYLERNKWVPRPVVWFIFPKGRWFPQTVRKRFGGYVSWLGRREHVFTSYVFWSPLVMTAAALFRPSSDAACGAMFAAAAAFQMLIAIFCMLFMPYRAVIANVLQHISTMCIGIILSGSAASMITPGNSVSRTLVTKAAQIQMAVALLRMAHGVFMYIMDVKFLLTTKSELLFVWQPPVMADSTLSAEFEEVLLPENPEALLNAQRFNPEKEFELNDLTNTQKDPTIDPFDDLVIDDPFEDVTKGGDEQEMLAVPLPPPKLPEQGDVPRHLGAANQAEDSWEDDFLNPDKGPPSIEDPFADSTSSVDSLDILLNPEEVVGKTTAKAATVKAMIHPSMQEKLNPVRLNSQQMLRTASTVSASGSPHQKQPGAFWGAATSSAPQQQLAAQSVAGSNSSFWSSGASPKSAAGDAQIASPNANGNAANGGGSFWDASMVPQAAQPPLQAGSQSFYRQPSRTNQQDGGLHRAQSSAALPPRRTTSGLFGGSSGTSTSDRNSSDHNSSSGPDIQVNPSISSADMQPSLGFTQSGDTFGRREMSSGNYAIDDDDDQQQRAALPPRNTFASMRVQGFINSGLYVEEDLVKENLDDREGFL